MKAPSQLLPVAILGLLCCSSACSFTLGGIKPAQAFPAINGELVQAAVDGDTREMEKLVRQGADPNSIGVQGSTPLIWAMSAHSHRGVEKLLDLGADPNASFEEHGKTVTVMWVAAGGNDIETLRIVLEHGGNPNTAYRCKTPLMAAVSAFDLNRLTLLINHGADVNGIECGDTAPEFATYLGRFDFVLYFLSKGFKVQLDELAVLSNDSYVPKDSSAYKDKQQVLEILRNRGARIPAPKQ